MSAFSGRKQYITGLISAIFLVAVAGCKKEPPPQPMETQPVTTAPKQKEAAKPSPSESQPATQPTEEEKPKPTDTQPASSFDPRPPYTVKLYVNDPQDKQPGWLAVRQLIKEGSARAIGTFPSQNVLELETENVKQIRINIGFLPLRKGKRTILHIDQQSMEITRPREQKYLSLRRNANGRWVPAD